MELKKSSLPNWYNNFSNGNNIYLFKDINNIITEYQKELNCLDKEIENDEININNKLYTLKNVENEKINTNVKTEYNSKFPIFFEKYSKTYYIPKREKNVNNRVNKNIKKHNNKGPISIIKSEPNLFKRRNNDFRKKIIYNTNNNSFENDFSNISEIKKQDFSYEEQNNNSEIDKKYSTLYDFYNNLNCSKEKEGIVLNKKNEIKKLMNEFPELIYNEIYKNFSKFQNLKKENNLLKNKIKKLNLEIKEKNNLIDEFTDLFKQSRIKFQKLILKNTQNIEEIENKNNIEIKKLNDIIHKLKEENNILNNRNKKLLNNINKYQKYTKTIEEKFSKVKNNIENKNNIINKFKQPTQKINKDQLYINITSRAASSILNSKINGLSNYSKDLNSFYDNKENIGYNVNKKFNNYNLIVQYNKRIDNENSKINLKKNNISKVGVESNLRKEKAIFRDLSAKIEKKINKECERKRENSVRIMNTINGCTFYSDKNNFI